MTWPAVTENIAIMIFVGAMVWLTESAWWVLLLVFMNNKRSSIDS